MDIERVNGAADAVLNRYRKESEGMTEQEKDVLRKRLMNSIGGNVASKDQPEAVTIRPDPVATKAVVPVVGGTAIAAAATGSAPIPGGGGITAAEAVARVAGGEPIENVVEAEDDDDPFEWVAVGTTAKYGCPHCGGDHLDVPVYQDGSGYFFPCPNHENKLRVAVEEGQVVLAPAEKAPQADGDGGGLDSPPDGQEAATGDPPAFTGETQTIERGDVGKIEDVLG